MRELRSVQKNNNSPSSSKVSPAESTPKFVCSPLISIGQRPMRSTSSPPSGWPHPQLLAADARPTDRFGSVRGEPTRRPLAAKLEPRPGIVGARLTPADQLIGIILQYQHELRQELGIAVSPGNDQRQARGRRLPRASFDPPDARVGSGLVALGGSPQGQYRRSKSR
jgi:hypothetical protein